MIIEALLAKMKKFCYESVLTDCKCAKMYHGICIYTILSDGV